MKCFITNSQGINALQQVERPSPDSLNGWDVLVDVKACALNYRDLLVVNGQYGGGAYPAFIPLSDMAGVVRAVGAKVTELRPGDRVLNSPFRHWPGGKLTSSYARTFIGGTGVDGVLAEQVSYPADALVRIPAYLDFPQASTFTVAGLTAWAAVVTHGKTRPGEWVLLQGTGGVSLFAAQLARAMGARTILTTSNAEKAKLVKEKYGVTATVNYRDAAWYHQVKEITRGNGVDVVVDVVGGATLAQSLQICAYGARVAVVGVLAGQETTLRIRDLLTHQVELRGIYMESTQELRAFMQAVETLQLKPAVDKVFGFDQTQEAYRYLEAQKHVGKVVISL